MHSTHRDWQGWELCPASCELQLTGELRFIALDALTTGKMILDRLSELMSSEWTNEKIIAGVLVALDDVFAAEYSQRSRDAIRELVADYALKHPERCAQPRDE